MNGFVNGVLLSNKEGAKYEDVTYTRFLTIRTVNGVELTILDGFGTITNDIPPGAHIECVLAVFPAHVHYFPQQPAPVPPPGFWQGNIVEPHWQAPQGSFRRFSDQLYAHAWLLLATPLGQLLMHPKELKKSVWIFMPCAKIF